MRSSRPDGLVFRRGLRRASTSAEAVLWRVLRGRRFGGVKFRRQHPVGRYVLDFCAPEVNLGIEIDGDSHYAGSGPERDEERTAFLAASGIRILRFTNADVWDREEDVLETLWRELHPSP